MNTMHSRAPTEVRWKPQEGCDGVPRRPARRTSVDNGRSVGRWKSEGDMSGLFPPLAPQRGSPQHRGSRHQQLNRWTSRPNVLRADSLPFQPGRRNSNITVSSDLDSSALGCGSSLGSSAMNSRCSNVSVSSMETPAFVAFPVQRLPLPGRRGVMEPIQRRYQSIPAEIDRNTLSAQSTAMKTKTFVLKLNAEATRNRKLSRSRSNQSALQKVARAASKQRHCLHDDEGCVTLPDDWMKQDDTGSESGDTKCSDLFADMEAAADQQLKQLVLAAEGSESRPSPRNEAAKVA